MKSRGLSRRSVLAGVRLCFRSRDFSPVPAVRRWASPRLRRRGSSSSVTPKAPTARHGCPPAAKPTSCSAMYSRRSIPAVQAPRPGRVLQQGGHHAPRRRHPRQSHLRRADRQHGHAAHRAGVCRALGEPRPVPRTEGARPGASCYRGDHHRHQRFPEQRKREDECPELPRRRGTPTFGPTCRRPRSIVSFGGATGGPTIMGNDAAAEKLRAYRQSVLDSVTSDLSSTVSRLRHQGRQEGAGPPRRHP